MAAQGAVEGQFGAGAVPPRVVSHAVEPFNGRRDRRPVFSDLVRELGEPERGGAGTSARGGDIERGQTFDPERVLESPPDQVLDATLAEVEPGLPVFRLAWREHHTCLLY